MKPDLSDKGLAGYCNAHPAKSPRFLSPTFQNCSMMPRKEDCSYHKRDYDANCHTHHTENHKDYNADNQRNFHTWNHEYSTGREMHAR